MVATARSLPRTACMSSVSDHEKAKELRLTCIKGQNVPILVALNSEYFKLQRIEQQVNHTVRLKIERRSA